MRAHRAVLVWIALAVLSQSSFGQAQAPSETLLIDASGASTWAQGQTNVIQLDGPVTIKTDTAHMSAHDAVIWLTPVSGGMLDQQQAEIALIGDAKVEQAGVTRTGPRLMVTAVVRGSIRITAEDRVGRDLSDSDLYKRGAAMRPGYIAPPTPGEGQASLIAPMTQPATRPAGTIVKTKPPVNFRARNVETTQTADDKVAIVLSGGVTLFQNRDNGDFIELQADRVVLFTTLSSLREANQPKKENTTGVETNGVEDNVEAAYLENDVRITYTPALATKGEQRLLANRAYYEFTTDRAILTDAILHTIEPQKQIPVIIRANTMRQLSQGEYRAEQVKLSTSAFVTPSYAIAADKAYVRQVDTGDPRLGNRTLFDAHDVTFNLSGVPVFWMPVAAGSMTDRGFPLRDIEFIQNNRFGTGMRTEWGLFETIGEVPPRDLDISFRADYLSDRGPATGLDAKYGGGLITETTRDPWNFSGDLKSYLIEDKGKDEFGGVRQDVEPPDETRGRVLWEHQHFFPQDWQVQLRAGYVSDPTFLEEYFPNDFDNQLPQDLSAYVKRQRDTEALTFFVNYQPQDFVTSSDFMQEQFEVEHLPEIGYRRIGDSLLDDNLTLFSENTVAGMRFHTSDSSLAEQGFPPGVSPGIPSLGQTGVNDDVVYRGDFRQEIDYPFSAGQFRVVPYIIGRYIPYTDSPENGAQNRLFAGTGFRATTAFWKTDDQAQSELFDIHRVRHVIEPEFNFFTSAQTVDRNQVFQYEEPVDDINDITAVQLALHQRWQTKRGGPGRWRNVDFLTLNVEGNMFFNQPRETDLAPSNFRGLYFPSLPEASIPRNSINADATWRVSDSTILLSDIQYNVDKGEIATASIGLAVSRDTMTYFVGTRYIEELNSNITTLAINYQLTQKYTVALSQSFDFSQNQNVLSSVTIERRFDRFFASVTVFYNSTQDESGFSVSLQPEGLSRGIGSNSLSTLFPQGPAK